MTLRRCSTALVLALAGTLLCPPGPAAAGSVDGHATALVTLDSARCGGGSYAAGSEDLVLTPFTEDAAPQRVRAHAHAWVDRADGPEVEARGATVTRVALDVRRRALDELRVHGHSRLRLDDLGPADCGGAFQGVSQSSTEFAVRSDGTLRVRWDHDRFGNLTDVYLGRVGGEGLRHLHPARRHAAVSFAVRPGRYFLYTRYLGKVREEDTVDGTAAVRTSYRIVADYRS